MINTFETELLSQGYGSRSVIADLTMRGKGPGVLALLGPNGAGKSTLIKTIATVMPHRSGVLKLFGREIRRDADARWARRHIGYLPQDFGFYPSFSVYEFVRYCAWLRCVPAHRVHGDVLAALESVQLGGHLKTKMKELSGGMLRRAGIAQALVGDVRLVVLDEPTVGLDPEQRLEFRRLIRSVAQSATVLLSTHLVEDVSVLSDRLWVFEAGRAVFEGTSELLIASAEESAAGDSPLEKGYTSVLRTSVRA